MTDYNQILGERFPAYPRHTLKSIAKFVSEVVAGAKEEGHKEGRAELARDIHRAALLLRAKGFSDFAQRVEQLVDGLSDEEV